MMIGDVFEMDDIQYLVVDVKQETKEDGTVVEVVTSKLVSN